MPVKYTTVKAQVLIVAALFTWISASAVAPTPHSYALDSMNVTRALLSNKRSLRSNADMTLSTLADEERARPPLSTGVAEDVSESIQKFQAKYQIAVNKKFAKMKFDTTNDNFLERRAFGRWVRFIDSLGSDATDEAKLAAMFKTLEEKHYKGDKIDVIVAGTKIVHAKSLFKKRLDVEAKEWVHEKRSVQSVFELLKLNQEGINLFRSYLCSTWVTFVKKKYAEKADVAMLANLKKYYKINDRFSVLVEGMEAEGMKNTVRGLLNMQITELVEGGKYSPEQIFKLLKLDQTENPFASQLFLKWYTLVIKPTYEIYSEQYMVMFAILKKYYNGGLVKALVAKEKARRWKILAEKLLDLQVKEWVKAGKSSMDVFNLLELRSNNGNPFENSLFLKWAAFVALRYPGRMAVPDVSKSVPMAYMAMLGTLKESYKGDDLARVLDVGTRIEGTKQIAESLESTLRIWEAATKD